MEDVYQVSLFLTPDLSTVDVIEEEPLFVWPLRQLLR